MSTNAVTPRVKLKRAYDAPSASDGRRVLIDRIWPRGVTKRKLRLDGWFKELAPSSALRTWFGHDPARWNAFRSRYFKELDARPKSVERIASLRGEGTLTLVFAARDTHRNNAVALKDYLERTGRRSRRKRASGRRAGRAGP